MTAEELIAKLKKLDPKSIIKVFTCEYCEYNGISCVSDDELTILDDTGVLYKKCDFHKRVADEFSDSTKDGKIKRHEV